MGEFLPAEKTPIFVVPPEVIDQVIPLVEDFDVNLVQPEPDVLVMPVQVDEFLVLKMDPGEPGARGPTGPAGAPGDDAPTEHGDLTGLTDDDHTQYLKERASGGAGTEVPVHTHVALQGGTVSHDDLIGVSIDDHHAQIHADQHAAGSGDPVMDGTAPSTQAFGDAAAAGSAAFAAKRDHKHAMPANPVTAHEGAGDPHPGYRLESADHSHATTGLQGGTVDHGVLTGLTDDDHTIYLKEKASGGTAAEVPAHTHATAAQGGIPQHLVLHDIETYERVIIVAHRGDMNATDGYPEGTMEGYRQAAVKGVNRADLDCRRNSDGTWYIMHDATVDRTTGGTGTIASKTNAQVEALVIDGGVGYVAARHSGLLGVPTLLEVINAMRPYDLTFQLDCKVTTDAATLAQFVVDQDLVHRTVIVVTDSGEWANITAIDSRIQTNQYENGVDWDDPAYDQAAVFALAPLAYGVTIPIEDFGSADEGAIVTTAIERGVRRIVVNDIDAALAAKRAFESEASSGSGSGSGPAYIPFGSEASAGETFNNSAGGSEAYTQFGNVTRLFDPGDYSATPQRIVLEAHALTADVAKAAKVRLWDITDGVLVSGSAIVTSSLTADRIRSAGLTLDAAEHEYRVEVGAAAGGVATVYDAVLIVGSTSTVNEGADGESAPPPPVSGLLEDVVNEIRNYPSLEQANDVQPLWWLEDHANATLTEVDLAGEGITEKYERALKLVVATAGPHYGYQLFTYADEPRLKSGKTYSVAVDVWAVGAIAARIRLRSSVGSLGVSADTTAAAWTRLEVEGIAINGTTIAVELECAVGTAYFVPLGLVEGVEAPTTQLRPRSLVYRNAIVSFDTAVESLAGSTTKAVADVDLTAVTSPLAVMGNFVLNMGEGTTGLFDYYVRPNGTTWSVTGSVGPACRGRVEPSDAERSYSSFVCPFDDGQIIETALANSGGGTIDACLLYLNGFWEWE